MKILRFIISAALAIAVTYALNTKFGQIPPLGKFLDPVSGFWANAESNEIKIPEHLHKEALKSPVTIKYDDMLVPHIFTENDEDLYFAQGYVHAYHRLFQMEIQTHAAGGRASEILGDGAVEYDRGQRRKGMVFGAENFMEQIEKDPFSLMAVEQYTGGVNALINSLSYKDLPLEYKLLDYRPETWTSLKCALLLKYMSDMLNASERDLQNTNFLNIYGREYLDLLYPDIDNYGDPVVDKTNQWDFEPLTITKDTLAIPADELISMELLPGTNPNYGSNNWAVGPEKSATRNPILCNDMHLGLNVPSLWFYNQLNAPGINTFGHSLLGVPGVIQGFNDSIAWGFTNAQRDLVDWYVIEFKDDKMEEYFLDGEYIETTKVVEEIKIRGQESVYDTVVYTVFGPVVYDNNFRSTSGKKGYAMRWIAHDPSEEFKMFNQLNRAKNINDYLDATKFFSSPAQNIIFADVKGNIAHKVQGKYPFKGFEEGKFLMDGTESKNNWQEFIPNDHNAFWQNPERGFVASANQHPTDSTYPYYVTSFVYESYRNRRINKVLRADSSVTVEDMKSLHYDNHSTKAEESLPHWLTYLDSASLENDEEAVVSVLKDWDYRFEANSEAAIYYDSWREKLFDLIWDEIKNNDAALKYPSDFNTIRLMKEVPDLEFYDVKTTPEKETLKDVMIISFKEMVMETNDWKELNGEPEWSKYKGTYLRHLTNLRPLGTYDIVAGGNGQDVVNATGANWGPSERIIIELDPTGVKAWGHYPGGQSGNPGSPYYDNMVDAWATGEYYDLLFLKSAEEESDRLIHSLTLELPHEE